MLDEIIEVFIKVLELQDVKVGRETLILEELGANSLDIIDIVSELEDTYGITIPDEAIPEFKTVADVADFVEHALDVRAEL